MARSTPKADKKTRPSVDKFIAEYLRCNNGKHAAIAAGYSPKTAESQASRLLSKVKVREAVDNYRAENLAAAVRNTGVTLERVIAEIAKGAFFDPRKLFNAQGEPLAITELDNDTASVIAGFEAATERSKRGEDGNGDEATLIRKYKLADRKGFLDMLMKHLGGYAKDNEATVTVKESPRSIDEIARRTAFVFQEVARAKRAANDQGSPPRQATS